MDGKRDDEIVLFISDAETGRYLFNPAALRALGVDPAKASQCGYDSLSFPLPGGRQEHGSLRETHSKKG
jgi:hypothetical protein